MAYHAIFNLSMRQNAIGFHVVTCLRFDENCAKMHAVAVLLSAQQARPRKVLKILNACLISQFLVALLCHDKP